MNLLDSWRQRAEELCRRIDSDLTDTPIYLVSVDEAVAVDLRLRGGNAIAWTSPLADLLLKAAIGDRWRGPGFCAVIDRSKTPGIRDFCGAVLHEVAHYLDEVDPDLAAGRCPKLAAEAQAALPVALADPNTDQKPPDGEPRWFRHGSRFVRAAAHLAHRGYLNTNCGSLRPHHLGYATPYFEGVSELTFQFALASELDSDKPIRSILLSEPPATFLRCWAIATGQDVGNQKEDQTR